MSTHNIYFCAEIRKILVFVSASNEYPQHTFLWRNKKNIGICKTHCGYSLEVPP